MHRTSVLTAVDRRFGLKAISRKTTISITYLAVVDQLFSFFGVGFFRRRNTNQIANMKHTIEVWSEFACFSAPANKVERFSYPCPTPSAARGVFDAIYCHRQEFRWQVTQIEMLTFPNYIALRRNEVKEKVSVTAVKKWIKGTAEPTPLIADFTGKPDTKGRTQRQTMALSQVRYRLHGEIRPWPTFEKKQKAFDQQFIRRVDRGKCFHQPYLGCREFVAFFDWPKTDCKPIPFSRDLGLMLYDVFDLSVENDANAAASISIFRARIENGVLNVPEFTDAKVLKPQTGDN